MFKKCITVAFAATVVFSSAGAFAANPTAVLTITEDGVTWSESLTGLLAVDAQNNFTMKEGVSGYDYFQNGSFLSAPNTDLHPDYWQWTAAIGKESANWTWHSTETKSTISLKNVGGHGDPDLFYGFSANNRSSKTQTYTFVLGEEIAPTVNSANTVYADIGGALTGIGGGTATIAPVGANSAIQKFQLSADLGYSFVDTSVNVGPTATVSGTALYGTFAAEASGPTGQTWNYMQIVSAFTLTTNSSASLVAYASITPVPEPDSYAMLLAGLGLMGALVRRNMKNQA